MSKKDKTIILDLGHEEVVLPYEVLQLAKLMRKHKNDPPERVLASWLGRKIERGLKDASWIKPRLEAYQRYCEAEGLSMDDYIFKRCQARMRRILKQFRTKKS